MGSGYIIPRRYATYFLIRNIHRCKYCTQFDNPNVLLILKLIPLVPSGTNHLIERLSHRNLTPRRYATYLEIVKNILWIV